MKNLLLSALFLVTLNSLHAERPNIVFIYADDWGWGDLACHGHPELKTPNLDRLAKEGTDFQQFVVCNPVCSPSRTAIVTGQYPARHGVHQHFASHEQNAERGMPDWLDPKVTLLPRLMQQAGYKTGHFGKWHLSGGGRDMSPPLPAEYGYDEAAVWTGPGRSVFDDTDMKNQLGRGEERSVACFQTTAATEHALRFIQAAKDQPFYLNLWLHEAHHLVAATEEDKQAYPDTAEPQRTYFASLTRADKQIGRVLALLDELGLTKNTLVIFSSDNGPENSMPDPGQKFYYSVGDTGGLRGRKRSLYMGGVNVPFLVRWPGAVPAGRVDKTSVLAGVDVMPTVLAACGIQAPTDWQSDGTDIIAALKGETFTRPEPLFWEWRGPNVTEANWPQLSMRDGFHTLLMSFDAKRIELYDLAHDRKQENNLATAQPERTAKMVQAILAWQKTLPSPKPPVAAKTQARKPAKSGSAKPSADLQAVFGRWDKDGNGSLTLAEYTDGLSKKDNAPQRFKTFDKNDDGLVSVEEFSIRN
ncbi:N-acetylgalactosamine-6-sulfatase [Prosthecobacter fusiformis]|uniref:N-acetylgalactosamine-6-sulfatase n=1 Tax=Prosthecobacter fusiformis TaxID=48464 RepID=A0A4R7SS54_9BACT|nr:sulfatase-like hydrolase/transferase [Prosthecobacter fusiformis]TDU81008.1 N-acetylgalactosamine-6-sulfatase [Prosthecobacter fusiformis]